MSHVSFSSESSLLVRDARGRYLPATAEQIFEAARQAIDKKMQRGADFSSSADPRRICVPSLRASIAKSSRCFSWIRVILA